MNEEIFSGRVYKKLMEEGRKHTFTDDGAVDELDPFKDWVPSYIPREKAEDDYDSDAYEQQQQGGVSSYDRFGGPTTAAYESSMRPMFGEGWGLTGPGGVSTPQGGAGSEGFESFLPIGSMGLLENGNLQDGATGKDESPPPLRPNELLKQRITASREKVRLHETDSGSCEFQVATMTERILHLTEHMKINKKDFSTKRGLIALVNKRRRLLNYLYRESEERYHKVVSSLGIRHKAVITKKDRYSIFPPQKKMKKHELKKFKAQKKIEERKKRRAEREAKEQAEWEKTKRRLEKRKKEAEEAAAAAAAKQQEASS
mmetsp:Transcript_8004/g.18556  ORF Transcript_8004/g.18556 Transcript_8004/m.18556 type:complete len:315 (-) Transcript_8004:182-1126(-)